MIDTVFQYILGFCTWYGLSSIGEPPESVATGDDEFRSPQVLFESSNSKTQDPMPAWLIVLFFALVAARYIGSYLVSAFHCRMAPLANLLVFVYISSYISRSDGIIRRYFDI